MDIVSAETSLRNLESKLFAKKQNEGLQPGGSGERVLELMQSRPVVEGGVSLFLQGLFASFSDEIIGTLADWAGEDDELTKAINLYREHIKQPPVSRRDVNIGRQRQEMGRYRKAHPGKAIAAEIAGAVAPGFIPGIGQASLARAAALGLGHGALTGYGSGEGGPLSPDRLSSAGYGGVVGGVVPPALRGVGSLLGRGWRSVFSPGPAGRGVNQANIMARQAIEDDAGTLTAAGRELGDARAVGKPMAPADLGPDTRALTDAARVRYGSGGAKKKITDFFEGRDKDMVARLSDDLQRAFGKRARFFTEFKSMSADRAARGGKIYDRANKKTIAIGPELTSLFQRPAMKEALAEAYKIAANRGIRLPVLRIDGRGRLVTKTGQIVNGVQTKFLHYLKMGLDDKIYSALPTAGIGRTQRAGMQDIRHGLLNIIDEQNKTYKVARNYWAGKTASMDAMKRGRKFLSDDVDELADDISRMGRGETDAFRIGAMQALMDKIEGSVDTANIARNLMKTTRNKKLIRMTFGPGEKATAAYNKFVKNLQHEMDMKQTSAQVLGGSPTQLRAETQRALREGAERTMPRPVSVYDTVYRLVQKNAEKLTDVQLDAATKRIADIMTATGADGQEKILRELASPSGARRILNAVRDLPPAVAGAVANPLAISQAVAGGERQPDKGQIGSLLGF